MRKESTCKEMTVAEVYRRLRSVKRMLNNKSVSFVYDSEILCLNIELQTEIDFYLAPINFNDSVFFEAVTNNKKLFDRNLFIQQDLNEYVRLRRKKICKSFAITAMLLANYSKRYEINKHIIICTGSIYHAPRIFYRDEKSKKVIYEKSSEYLDLM
jgi:hypothetical protein